MGFPTADLAVYAYIVPDADMTHAVLLGHDSVSYFPVRKYRNVSDTMVTFVGNDEDFNAGDHRYAE